ncbi:DUF3105 domain-containing protein [Polyangium mundeleinium]|uniref:DUF3105 domain-containing protein n=1 Tax=Polyangium mundeleinium TaxID=2995306 RepID=A0ABT5F4F7_9BACT|nr:DUF3105 domain-containing protein [Polyangium mundeleinium]MDC0748982.1 DUF3105 domain-containing protein [Polyangium mundeleinium]
MIRRRDRLFLRSAVALGALALPVVVFACSPVETVSPAPVDAGAEASSSSSSSSTSSSSSSSSGAGGQGGGGSGGAGGVGGSGGTGGVGGSGGGGGTGGGSGGAGGSGSGTGGVGGSGGAGGVGGSGGAGGSEPDAGPGDAGACPVTTMAVPIAPAPHVVMCSPVVYATNPPTSGPHYPSWAAFKWYDAPVPRGFLVHSMEHGAVVISYHCEGGCESELATLAAFLDARPADPLCVAPLKARIIVVPDPALDVRFAAAAWGGLLRADCLDTAALGAFLDTYYAKGPENFCYDGVDVLAPGSGVPADCGTAPMDAGAD